MKIKRGDTYQIKLYLEPGKISDHNRRDNGTLKFTGVASWFIGLFIDVNIDFSFKEANYFYCRCRDLDGGSARCTGANALSLRRNCYKGSTTVLCKNWQSNCE